MGGTQHRVSNSRVKKTVADKYRKKYARDVKYLTREHMMDDVVYQANKKESVVETRRKPDTTKTEITTGKRYFFDYAMDEKKAAEKIEGKCVWTDGEYFMVKDGQGTRTLRVKYVVRIKEIK